MRKSILSKPPVTQTPSSYLEPKMGWNIGDFNELISSHGYDSYIDKALRCPCVDRATGQAQATCNNCIGKGWFFVDRCETKVVAQSMDNKRTYMNYGEINRGTARITSRGIDKLGFMDRIILLDLEAFYSEILRPILYNGSYIAYPVYEPLNITNAFLYVGDDIKLKPLSSDLYVVDGNKITFDPSIATLTPVTDIGETSPQISISIRYSYFPVYHVIDANRELMRVRERGGAVSEDKLKDMPINVNCRKAHLIFDAQRFNVDLLDNTLTP